MKQLQIDTRVLLLAGLLFQSQLLADTALNHPSPVTGGGIVLAGMDDSPKLEIDRLRQTIVESKVETESMNSHNKELHSRRKELESRILELRKGMQDQDKGVDKPDIR